MTADDIDDLRQLLAAHRQTLAILLKQVARQSEAYALPGQINGIVEARTEIARLKQALHDEGVEVPDAPNDQATDQLVSAGSPRGVKQTIEGGDHNIQAVDSTVTVTDQHGKQIINADVVGIVNASGADMSGAQGIRITGVQVGSMTKKRKTGRKGGKDSGA